MKNFYGVKLSEPFSFRLYEDCNEMAKFASDNNKKLDADLMKALYSINSVNTDGKTETEESQRATTEGTGSTHETNQNIDNPAGKDMKTQKSPAAKIYSEIVNLREDLLDDGCWYKKLFTSIFCREDGNNDDVNIYANANEKRFMKSNWKNSYKRKLEKLLYLYGLFDNEISEDDISILAKVHTYLTGIVAPATAATILFTKPTVNFPFTRSITTIPVMRNMMIGALISLLVFVIFLLLSSIPDDTFKWIFPEWVQGIIRFGKYFGRSVTDIILSLSASTLGAYLYSLKTANRYFMNGTFDRKYVTYYNNRIIIGMISGFILANLIKISPCSIPVLNSNSTPNPHDIKVFNDISFVLLAVLGGYAAEVVMVLLNRIMAMIYSLLTGEMKDLLNTKEQEYKQKAELENFKFKADKLRELIKFSGELSAYSGKDNILPDLKNKLDDFIKKFEL
jgi:hypothetical protein